MPIVDIECPELNLKVYSNEIEAYHFTLTLTELSENINKFFICQLLVKPTAFFIFTRSGRVGYKGTTKLDCFLNKQDALKSFFQLFYEKTGLTWQDRNSKDSSEFNGKYTYITKTTEELKSEYQIQDNGQYQILSMKVATLIKTIFNNELYSNLSFKYKLNNTKAPLGTISKKQIKMAFQILSKISDELNDSSKVKVLEKLSSKFYSIIPTISGMSKLPVIKSEKSVKKKQELLEILENMTVTAKKMHINTISGKYLSLNCDIKEASKIDCCYIMEYFNNSISHKRKKKMSVSAIYSINRHNSELLNLHNKQLLWHGSRMENFVSILSRGLIINPDNVVKTGSMYGNGIYFANCVLKSANYIGDSKIGILLLCEVALGNSVKKYHADPSPVLSLNTHSVHGVGAYGMTNTKKLDFYNVSVGPITSRNLVSSLNYDEFIVYKERQVKIRYLLLIEK